MAALQGWRWQKRSVAPSLGRPGVVKDEACSVYAGNLPWRASEDDLVAFFSPAGRVIDVRRKLNEDGEPVQGQEAAAVQYWLVALPIICCAVGLSKPSEAPPSTNLEGHCCRSAGAMPDGFDSIQPCLLQTAACTAIHPDMLSLHTCMLPTHPLLHTWLRMTLHPTPICRLLPDLPRVHACQGSCKALVSSSSTAARLHSERATCRGSSCRAGRSMSDLLRRARPSHRMGCQWRAAGSACPTPMLMCSWLSALVGYPLLLKQIVGDKGVHVVASAHGIREERHGA